MKCDIAEIIAMLDALGASTYLVLELPICNISRSPRDRQKVDSLVFVRLSWPLMRNSSNAFLIFSISKLMGFRSIKRNISASFCKGILGSEIFLLIYPDFLYLFDSLKKG